VGELGVGWITPLPTPARLREGPAAIRTADQQQGRQPGDLYVVVLTTACVTQPGEALPSPRMVARVGPRAALQPPADRCYQDVHAGHLIYLKPGEERFLTELLIRRGGLIGTGEEMIAQLKALEEAGLRQIAVQVVTNGRDAASVSSASV